MNNPTACPLDCFDACSVVFSAEKLCANKEHAPTQGFLCPHLNHYLDTPRIEQPRYKGEPVTMEEAVAKLKEMVRGSEPKRTLLYRSGGNMGLMQQSMDYVLGSFGATLTKGSLCDGAGEAGIVEGRGVNRVLAPEEVAKAEVVVLWGRNPHATNTHMLPHLKGKTLIVIDPYKTDAAKEADLHIQLKPHADLYLALLIARFAMIQGHADEAYLREHAEAFEEFYELTQTIRIKSKMELIDVTLGEIGKFLELVSGKRTVILMGVGVQKYRSGDEVVRAIDGLGAFLGLFGKEGCGVGYLGSSMQGIENPFSVKAPRVFKANTEFSAFDTVIIQGANPVAQMPNANRTRKSIESVQNVVYFGLYENESSEAADLIIPAKSFLEKNDIRASYGSDEWLRMPKQYESGIGIGEFALASELAEAFGIALDSESDYIESFASQCEERDGRLLVKGRMQPPYQNGFETDDGQFAFLEEYDSDFEMEEELFLLTSKSKTALNSQFRRPTNVHLHPALGFAEGSRARVLSDYGSVELDVTLDDALREDCILIYSGTPGVNNLTPSVLSYEGESAAYQEIKVKVEPC